MRGHGDMRRLDRQSTQKESRKMSDWKKEAAARNAKIQAFLNDHSIELTSTFVPFSQSRNAANDTGRNPDKRSLNWKVTLTVNNRVVMTTDYNAGIAHCPSYKQGARWTLAYTNLIIHETETGTKATNTTGWGISKGNPIKPDYLSVMYCLISDSNVFDYGSFEEWAREYDYDPDSRSAEKIYRDCLEIALKLRNAIGETRLSQLRELFQDY